MGKTQRLFCTFSRQSSLTVLLFAQLLDLLHMREGFTRPEFEVPMQG